MKQNEKVFVISTRTFNAFSFRILIKPQCSHIPFILIASHHWNVIKRFAQKADTFFPFSFHLFFFFREIFSYEILMKSLEYANSKRLRIHFHFVSLNGIQKNEEKAVLLSHVWGKLIAFIMCESWKWACRQERFTLIIPLWVENVPYKRY